MFNIKTKTINAKWQTNSDTLSAKEEKTRRYARTKREWQNRRSKSRKEKRQLQSMEHLFPDDFSTAPLQTKPDPRINTGTLQFDEEQQRCYITQDKTGATLKVRCAFEFFNGFVPLDVFLDRLQEDYTEEAQVELVDLLNLWLAGSITDDEIKTAAKKFC